MRLFTAVFLAAWLLPQSSILAQTTGGGTTGGGTTGGGAAFIPRGGASQGSQGNFGPTGGIGFGGTSSPNFQSGVGLSRGAGSNAIPTPANPFLGYFGNPLGVGVSGTGTTNVPKAAFGQPLFGAVTSTSTSAQAADNNAGAGFSTIGIRKAPPYVTVLGDNIPLIQHPPVQLERDLKNVLQRSSTLKGNIALTVTPDAVAILRGQVPSERDRRLAESLVRLTPGVNDVQNELTVGP